MKKLAQKEKTVTVILPTYNEKGNIIRLIKTIKQYTKDLDWELSIQVIDDNSPDGTGRFAQEVFVSDPSVKIKIRMKEKGLATALLHGIKSSKTRYILFMDSDFNHHPKYITNMLEFVEENPKSVISGSRYISGGGMDKKERFIGSQFINDTIKLLLGAPTTDYLSGFILIEKQTLVKLPLEWIFRGFGEWSLRLHFLLWKKKVHLREIPVFYPARSYGKTKMKPLKYAIALTKTLLELHFRAPRINQA